MAIKQFLTKYRYILALVVVVGVGALFLLNRGGEASSQTSTSHIVSESPTTTEHSASSILPVVATASPAVVSHTIQNKAQGCSSPAKLCIVSPRNGTVVAPGQTISVTVELAPGVSFADVQVVGEDLGITRPITTPPFNFYLTVPNEIIGPRKITAVGIIEPGNGVFSLPVTIDIETPTVVNGLEVSPPSITFDFVGNQINLTVIGRSAGGKNDLYLSDSSQLNYRSNNIKVATVDSSGLVTAIGPGAADIIVQYKNVSGFVAVTVPNSIKGDLTRDGAIDQDDVNVILDSLGKRSSTPTDARDLNKDGVINESDVAILKTLCTHPQCATY